MHAAPCFLYIAHYIYIWTCRERGKESTIALYSTATSRVTYMCIAGLATTSDNQLHLRKKREKEKKKRKKINT